MSRPAPGTSRHFPCFDGFRALAALSVVGVHTAFVSGFTTRSRLGSYTARLEIGVAVFFLISGFLLYRPFVAAHLDGRRLATRPFLRRRVLRIVPLYWFVLALATWGLHAVKIHDLAGVVILFGFLQIYSRTYVFRGISAAWSLCTEVTYYLFLPVYARALTRRRRPPEAQVRAELMGVGLLILASLAFRVVMISLRPPRWDLMMSWLPGMLDLFAVGMGLAVASAWAQRRDREPEVLRHPAMPWLSWALAGAAFWAVSAHAGIPRLPLYTQTLGMNLSRQTLYALFAMFLLLPGIFGPQDRGLPRRLLTSRAVHWAGIASYGIYLWHEVWITKLLAWRHLPLFGVHLPYLFGAVTAITLAVSAVTYALVERPFLRLKGRRLVARPAAEVRAPTVAADVGTIGAGVRTIG
jgi:peptidoglycan/LPS O-acetylase OafA/YrhL